MITPRKTCSKPSPSRRGYMRKHSRSKQWTVEVEMWGAAHARAVAKAVAKAGRREQVQMTRAWAEVQAEVQARPETVAQPWDLVRRQAQMWALASLLTEADARLWKRRQASTWFMSMTLMEMLAKGQAEEVKKWAQEQARQLAWAWAWAVEKETQMSVPATALEELGLGQVQVQAWLRMWTLEGARKQKLKKQQPRNWDVDYTLQGNSSLAYVARLVYLNKRVLPVPWVNRTHFIIPYAQEPDDTPPPDTWPRRQQGYWSLIQAITPIARLPPELLQHIFLITIDNASDSPLILMRACKYWYNIITGIWASLRLGTRTSKYVITRKLKRAQWLLDVLVDTEVDRRHFAPTEDIYQAIFAAMHAISRWRSLIVESFPARADLPEDLVNRGLQQCSDPVMSRLRTLIIKCPCEMSTLLDCLLRIIGNTASRELTTVTINSPDVISFLVSTYSSIFRSVTMLSLDARGLRNPVDLLPHVHQLETLEPLRPNHVRDFPRPSLPRPLPIAVCPGEA